jgi:glyoxylase-like metal-dependent hydrolase (beta-lactamase superfamily II)
MPLTDTPQPLEAVAIDKSTYCIEDNGVRCLLFIGAEKALLVDAGFGAAGSLRAVVESLTDKPVTLVITHADHDHIGGAFEFGPVHMHPSEMPHYLKNAKPDAQVSPLWEGEVIDIGGRSFEAVLIPGHTRGSIALLDRENRILLSGDSISSGPIFMFGEERCFTAFLASMDKLIAMQGAFDEIYPAHGPLPIPASQIQGVVAAAHKLLAGELTPEEPPFPLPAKMYMDNGAGFFY